jgi:hypothetical protein
MRAVPFPAQWILFLKQPVATFVYTLSFPLSLPVSRFLSTPSSLLDGVVRSTHRAFVIWTGCQQLSGRGYVP